MVLQGCGGGGSPTPAPGPTGPTTTILTTTTTTAPDYGAQIKTVQYNLFWWCVSGNPQHNPETHNEGCSRYTGGKGFQLLDDVIKSHMPFDLIGFSECLDIDKMMNGLGLAATFGSYLAPPQSGSTHDSGFLWSKDKFEQLGDPGADKMSHDMYGDRWLGYIRLKVKETGQTLLYANTHGGLGHCGEPAGREVYTNFMASIQKNRQDGDSVVVTGDFNCRPDELLMELITQNFSTVVDKTQMYDNIVRSNWVRLDEWVTKNAPPSDHSIVTATMSLPKWPAGGVVPDPPPAPGPGPKPPAPSPGPAPPAPPPGPKSKCADLGCGNHDATCWCVATCKTHNDCCDDYDAACPPSTEIV